jgi:hypothetical protein
LQYLLLFLTQILFKILKFNDFLQYQARRKLFGILRLAQFVAKVKSHDLGHTHMERIQNAPVEGNEIAELRSLGIEPRRTTELNDKRNLKDWPTSSSNQR